MNHAHPVPAASSRIPGDSAPVIADTGPSCPVPFGPASQSSAVPYGAFRPKAVAIQGLGNSRIASRPLSWRCEFIRTRPLVILKAFWMASPVARHDDASRHREARAPAMMTVCGWFIHKP